MNLKDRIWFFLLGSKWPEEKGYTIKSGFVGGTELRCESFDGGEMWINANHARAMSGIEVGIFDHGYGFSFCNFKPFLMDGKIWSVSPIQKKSWYGWIKTEPKSYWYWNMKKLQEYKLELQYGKYEHIWKPGTERGFCFRSTPCWRIDFASTEIDGIKRNWVPSGGHLSFKNYD